MSLPFLLLLASYLVQRALSTRIPNPSTNPTLLEWMNSPENFQAISTIIEFKDDFTIDAALSNHHFHQKRVISSRPMNNCSNPPSHFFSSWCAAHGDPQIHAEHNSANPLAVHVFCNDLTPTRNFTDPTPEYDYSTFCRADEICITQEDVPNPWLEGTDEAAAEGNTLTDLAWCVAQDNFVRIAQDQLSQMGKTVNIVAPWEPPAPYNPRKRVSAEASLINPDGKRGVLAQNMSLEAQMPVLVGGEIGWRTMIGGSANCGHCSSLQLGVVPQHSHRIVVKTMLEDAVPEALLYLTKLVT